MSKLHKQFQGSKESNFFILRTENLNDLKKKKKRSTALGTKALGREGERSDSVLAFKGQTRV